MVSKPFLNLFNVHDNSVACLYAFTIVWGFPTEIDLKLVCKEMATRFQCGGSIVEKPAQRKGVDVKINTVQLQGDHRNGVIDFLFEQAFISSSDQVTTIGF